MMDELDSRILAQLTTPVRADALAKALPDVSKRSLAAALDRMTRAGLLVRSKKNKYGRAEDFGCVRGIFLATERAFAFVAPEGGGTDVFIPPRADGGAWQGDRVLVRLSDTPRDKTRPEGEVVRVLEREKKDVTGTLHKRGRAFFLEPDSGKYPVIEIAKNRHAGGQPGDKAAVRVVFWGDAERRLPPQGIVTALLGESGSMDAAIAAILHENAVFEAFPSDALAQADACGDTVSPAQAAHRLDLRDKLIFTIDGDDAKDFDDAISLEPLENGHLLLGVHIADVSHYVTPGSPLDDEAWRRGTSVYFPGTVVPMLPVALSNGICSLNPDVDRLTFSAFLELDRDGRRHKAHFDKTVIRSKARMTYNHVNAILAGDAELRAQYAALVPIFETLNRMAHTLRRRRMERGALDLDIAEAEVVMQGGRAVDIRARPRGDAERLIEECMLLANEAVAEYMDKRGNPTVYRVHEDPDPEKLRAFAGFAKQFGYRVDAGKPRDTAQLQAVLSGAKDKPEQRILPTMLLRSLARARYDAQCIGHYGLQAKFYLHFTSPIRRYPDLVAHRMLHKALTAQPFTDGDHTFCADAAVQSTRREQAADNCERDVTKLYLADYMSRFLGEEFDGVVAGVTSFGVFIELANTVEGLVRIEELPGNGWEFDAVRMALTARSGQRITFGTPMRVRLVAASNLTGQIDFVPAGQPDAHD